MFSRFGSTLGKCLNEKPGNCEEIIFRDMAKKIVFYMVVFLVKNYGFPVYISCPLSTFRTQTRRRSEIAIKECDPQKVVGFRWGAVGAATRPGGESRLAGYGLDYRTARRPGY